MIHNLGEKTVVTEGVHHSELVEWIANGDIINKFKGAVEVAEASLLIDVPDTFPDNLKVKLIEESYQENVLTIDPDTGEEITESVTKTRMIPELDDEGNPVLVAKTFAEYIGGNYQQSTNTGKVLIPLGQRDQHGNRHGHLLSEEFYLWVNFWGIDNVRTLSEWHSLIASPSATDI